MNSAEQVIRRNIIIGSRSYDVRSDDTYLAGMGRRFEPATVHLMERLVEPGDLALDVGANIGLTSLLLSTLAREVWAFEPCPGTCAFLQDNLARGGAGNVRAFNFGLGSADSDAELTRSASNRSGAFVSSTLVRPAAGHVTERIAIRQADAFWREQGQPHVGFMKLDVEGFEGDVLRGARHLLQACQPVVVLELNHWCLNAFQRTSVPDFLDFLRGIFPVLLAVDGTHFADLHDPETAYQVMHQHITAFRFGNLVAAFESHRLDRFHDGFHQARGPLPAPTRGLVQRIRSVMTP
jgi:FkbM family methyltransferase